MAVVVAPAIGPTLGGWITDNFDWRWIFFINVPVGILSLILTSGWWKTRHTVEGQSETQPDRWPGLGLVAVGIGCMELVLDKGEATDWFSDRFITFFFVVAVVSLVTLFWWEWDHENPIMDMPLPKNRNFGPRWCFQFMLGSALFRTRC